MADPLSVTASIAALVIPALHRARLVIKDIDRIRDAPKNILSIKEDLVSIESSLVSLQDVNKDEWMVQRSNLAEQSQSLIRGIASACDHFRTDLARLTRHSSNGKLAWEDRARIDFFQESKIKSISEQLQARKQDIFGPVSIATLWVTSETW